MEPIRDCRLVTAELQRPSNLSDGVEIAIDNRQSSIDN